MNCDGLLAAWQLWIQGTEPKACVWLGASILWWGRIGKLLQLASALLIIAEIAGPDRLRSLGAAMRALNVFNHASTAAHVIKKFVKDGFTPNFPGGSNQYMNSPGAKLILRANFVVTLVITIEFGVWLASTGIPPLQAFLWSAVFVIPAHAIAPLSVVLLALLVSTFAQLLERIVLNPIAQILQIGHADPWIKAIGLLIFSIGFHFDLLAS